MNIKTTLAFLLLVIVCACNTKPKNTPKRIMPTQTQFNTFNNKINQLAKVLNINSMSYTIVNESKVLQYKAIGNANENTEYNIGAMSNIFASIIALQLAEIQELDLKKPLSDYEINTNNYANASIKNILSHTASNNPNSSFEYNSMTFNVLNNVFEKSTGKNYEKLFKRKLGNKFNLDNTTVCATNISDSCTSTVADIAKLSIAIDNGKIFENLETTEQMFRPIYLSNGEQTPASMGWFVQFYNNKKYAWNFGQGKNYSSLIIKSLSDSISLVIMANSANLNAPFMLHQANLFKSVIAVEFIKAFTLFADTIPAFNIFESSQQIKTALLNANKSKHRNLLVNEFCSYINMCQYLKLTNKTNELINIYNTALPFEIPYTLLEKTPRAIIANVGDYANYSRFFTINSDTIVNVFAVGEFTKEFVLQPYDYDNVELFIDILNEKKTTFDNTKCRQYRFNYNYPDITGNFSSSEDIKFVETNPTNNTYIFEIKIPWKTLSPITPKLGSKIGFDITTTDNDGKGRESGVNWHYVEGQTPWTNPSVNGTLVLCNTTSVSGNDSICYSAQTATYPIIDGKLDNCWNYAPKNKLTKTKMGKMPKSSNISASYRTVWDSENLYFLIEVTDNYKCLLPLSNDLGYIETEKHDTVWIMNENNTNYAGGSEFNKYANVQLPLKAGNYVLHYNSNQTNSTTRWIRKQPEISFYGIAVY